MGHRDDFDGRGAVAGVPGLEPFDAAARAQQLSFLGLAAGDAAALASAGAVAARSVDGILDRLHAHLLAFPPLATLLLAEPDRLNQLRESHRAYFLSLSGARFDEDYFGSRERVGAVHATIGLEPAWYVGAMAFYLRRVLRALVDERGDGVRILPALESLVKTIFLDLSLAMETYVRGGFVAREVAEGLERAARTAERALHDKAELERLKAELATMVVHDLKNPVLGIMMTLQLALRKDANVPADHRRALEEIDLTCREMMRLVQNLLEMARLDAGELATSREPTPLADVVAEVVGELERIVARSGRTLVTHVPRDVPAVLADRRLLQRVVANLVMNALRRGGTTVEVTAVTGPEPGEVTLEIHDRGRKIPPAEQAGVFAWPAATPGWSDDEGTRDPGLGMPFCKLAVERMGGRTTVTSSAEDGTAFAVTLPAAPSR